MQTAENPHASGIPLHATAENPHAKDFGKDATTTGIPDSFQDKLRSSYTDSGRRMIERNFMYHPPDAGHIEKYTALRERAKHLALLINDLCPASREQALALTNLEQAVMWANASIARNE